MTDFLLAAAGFILFTVAVGLVRILGGPSNADRMMAAQLLGTGGITSLLGRFGDGRARGGGRRTGACTPRRLRFR
jgi:multicomponent Na+:H+ antiporter subunit F